ncbi:Transcription repressor OFP8 [Linum perenne]
MGEAMAVVKKSSNPKEDFKRSMLEMISEREIYDGKELEELLQCLLSLNSRQYHSDIVEAFSDIWKVLFL